MFVWEMSGNSPEDCEPNLILPTVDMVPQEVSVSGF